MFFKNAVELLRQRNYEVLCTARDYRECVKLAVLKKFELKLVGKYGGVSKYDKLRASSSRIFELAKAIERFNPDLCISFSSPEAARVAFGLGIPHITFSDSPHAQAVQKLTIPFVNYLLCPWIIPFSAWTNFGIQRKQIVRYRGLDPVAWIRNETKNINSDNLKKKYHLAKSNTFVIRPEESKASYLIDTAHNNVNEILKSIVHNYNDSTNILVLCRYQDQIRQYKEKYGDKIMVLENVVDGLELLSIADIFIGGGGTMTAESALLGKPTISISPIKFYVDDYLVKTGLIYKIRNAAQIVKILQKIQSDDSFKLRQKNRAQHILNRMEDPANKLLKIVSKFVSL